MPSIGRIKFEERRKNFEERSDSKSRKLEKQGTDWSNVPRDIVECIIRHLSWPDRIRIRAVCKAWSVANRHIPTIDTDRIPWVMREFYRCVTEKDDCERVSWMIDPFSRQYPVEVGKECRIFLHAKPCASVYGWLLFEGYWSFYLYSPFTAEVINLPEFDGYVAYKVATFSLNATSPKSVIFLLHVDEYNRKVRVNLCSPGDHAWEEFEFNSGFDGINRAACAAYVDGVFYCLFSQGQLGAYDVQLEEFTILANHMPPNHRCCQKTKLVVSGSDLLLWNRSELLDWELFKFDFSKMHWVYENNLNNHVLFIGCTSFATPAVGEISQLTNTIFYCESWYPFYCDSRYPVTCYGRTSPNRIECLVYRKCVEATRCAKAWIQLPLGGIWRAEELINAA